MPKTARFLTAFAILFFGAMLRVQAHAILVRSRPLANQVIRPGSVSIELDFNSRIDGKRSRLILFDPNGQKHGLELRQVSDQSVTALAEHLTAGEYILRWQVLAEDGHITQGYVPFRVK